MTDLHRSSVLQNVQIEATLPRFSAARLLRAFLTVPALEASFLLSLLGFVALADASYNLRLNQSEFVVRFKDCDSSLDEI